MHIEIYGPHISAMCINQDILTLTGDNFVDGSDLAIADNNSASFVSVIRP